MTQLEEIYDREARDSVRLNTIPYEIRCRISEFSGAELKVFLCFLSHANKAGRTWAGRKLLIRETGLSEHGLDSAIAGLKKKGWVVRYQITNNKTGQRMTASTFCKWPPAVPGTHYDRIKKRAARG